MSKVRICFLGTPEFAAIHLQSLINDPHYEVAGVITQPDRPAGRKMVLTSSAVKVLAELHKIPVLTPENLRKDLDCLEIIKTWKAEVAVVVAYGQILSKDFLNSFPLGAVNVHGSLLPLWRGAAPIQRSLQAGDLVTGVSLQKMVFKLDAGAVIGERKIQLDDQINATELYNQLALLGTELLAVELMDYIRGNLIPVEQDSSQVTLAAKILKEESFLNFEVEALKFHNTVRAFSMGPGVYILFQGKRLKIIKSYYSHQNHSQAQCGQIIEINESYISIQTSRGLIQLLEVQPESKSKMKINDFIKTFPIKVGDDFV